MQSALKKLIHKGALLLGAHIGRFPPSDSLQGHLRSFFRITGINCVLDVGAHMGEYFETLREIGYDGRVVSFEPAKANYVVLARKASRMKHWLVRNLALGADEGMKEMNIYQGTVFNSFL